MADKLIRVSDISQEPATHRVNWSVGKDVFILDLTEDEFDEFNAAIASYRKASQRPNDRKGSAAGAASSTIRKWAQGQGLTVPARGRIPESIVEAYNAATG